MGSLLDSISSPHAALRVHSELILQRINGSGRLLSVIDLAAASFNSWAFTCGDLCTESGQNVHGSFSAVSKPIFSIKTACCSRFQNLKDLHADRMLFLFLRGVCGLASWLAEEVSSFSYFLHARPTFAPPFRWDFLGGFSNWDSKTFTPLKTHFSNKMSPKNSAILVKCDEYQQKNPTYISTR